MKKRKRGHSYVWHHPNGEIVGVGTILPDAPPQLRLALPPDDPQRLSLIEIEALQDHEPLKILEHIRVIAGELREREEPHTHEGG
jgi:hypothetical protein